MNDRKIKVALVHDFLREYGGAERVVEALHQLFPDAPLYTAFIDRDALGPHWSTFHSWDIRETWMAKIPGIHKLYSPLRILAPSAFRSLNLSDYDLVISSSNAYFAKSVKVKKPAIQLCYCHTPPRALYGYTTMSDWHRNPITHVFGTLLNHYCRVVDYNAAQAVDYFIANSEEVKRRIKKFYRRDSQVIWPPVNVPEKLPALSKINTSEYFLYVNRLALAKHPELAVQVCNELKLPLKVVGSGKMSEQLKQMAGSTIEFLGSVNDEELNKLYLNAKGLIYPVEDEDFGIVPVEAMGYGVPVIAHRSGGPKETIIENKTGVFFDDLTIEGLKTGLKKFGEITFDRQAIAKHAQQFRAERFLEEMKQFIAQVLPPVR